MYSTPVEADHGGEHGHRRGAVVVVGAVAAADVPAPADTGAEPEPVAVGTEEVAAVVDVVVVDSAAAVAGMAGADCTVAGVVDTVAEAVVDNDRD